MSNVFKNILNSLKLTEDEDDYDDYLSEIEERDRKRALKQEQKEMKAEARRAREEEDDDEEQKISVSTETRKERAKRMEGSQINKVVPIRTSKGFEVCIMKPTTFEDSQDICDMLLTGRAAVINLEGFDVELAQRIMDFISGSVYAMNGKLHQISSYIFIISPDTVDISGDYLDLIPTDGFEVPTLNKEF